MRANAVPAILEKHRGDGGGLISILEDIQDHDGYLSEDALRMVADETGRSLTDIFGVATFYRSFSLTPRGKHLICVCTGTACHVRGAEEVVRAFERQLAILAGETTPDGEFTLETVYCLGACALGPIVVVDGHYFSQVDAAKVEEILDAVRVGLDRVKDVSERRPIPLQISCPCCGRDLLDPAHPIEGHPSICVVGSVGGKRGWFRFSSLYGSMAVEFEWKTEPEEWIDFSCPHCHARLVNLRDCPECGAPMAMVTLGKGGALHICPRRQCKARLVDLNPVGPSLHHRAVPP